MGFVYRCIQKKWVPKQLNDFLSFSNAFDLNSTIPGAIIIIWAFEGCVPSQEHLGFCELASTVHRVAILSTPPH